jgi:hypothetical protein
LFPIDSGKKLTIGCAHATVSDILIVLLKVCLSAD